MALALSAAAQPTRTAGTVTALDAQRRELKIRTDEGAEAVLAVAADAEILSVSSDARDLSNAQRITFEQIAPGDRVVARGAAAGRLLVMSRREVERKQAAERADWEKRGVSGVILSLDPAARTITVRAQTPAGPQPLVIALAHNAVLRRYAPDSVRFSDARPCRFEDLEAGDQVRARGERVSDRFIAEEVVSGSFRTVVAVVESFDAGGNLLRVKDLETGRRVVIELRPDSRLRKMPEAVARILAARLQARPEAKPPAAAPETNARPDSVPPPGRFAPPGNGGRGLESFLERLPLLKPEELKAGDAILVSSTRGRDPARLAAITLLAGVEPLFESAPRQGRQAWLESWNLDLNMNVGW